MLFSTVMYLKENLVSSTFQSSIEFCVCLGSLEVALLLLFCLYFVSSGNPGKPTVEIICKECIMVWVSKKKNKTNKKKKPTLRTVNQ